MSMFKKCKVVMLPTNQKVINTKEYQLLLSNSLFWTSKIEIKRYTEGWFFLNNSSDPNSCAITIPNVENFKHQHLYIISDDEIKEGDWFINDLNQIKKCTSRDTEGYIDFEGGFNTKPSSCKKIIAATDSSLWRPSHKYASDVILLPQPSQQFIEKFIEEYNRGNVITDVLVEYNYNPDLDNNWDLTKTNDIFKFNTKKEFNDYVNSVKINPKDNTITIKKVKDSWNREEVENLIYSAMKDRCYTTVSEWRKWLEENL